MDRPDVLKQVNDIFMNVFENAELVIREQTSAQDIDAWDSLAHIHLIVAIERSFKIRFTSKEMQSWENVGEMIDSICSKIEG